MREKVKFLWYRNHHLYYGIALFLFGLYNYYLMRKSGELLKLKNLWTLLMVIGVFLAADDIVEHTITRDTPIRIMFEKFILPYLRD